MRGGAGQLRAVWPAWCVCFGTVAAWPTSPSLIGKGGGREAGAHAPGETRGREKNSRECACSFGRRFLSYKKAAESAPTTKRRACLCLRTTSFWLFLSSVVGVCLGDGETKKTRDKKNNTCWPTYTPQTSAHTGRSTRPARHRTSLRPRGDEGRGVEVDGRVVCGNKGRVEEGRQGHAVPDGGVGGGGIEGVGGQGGGSQQEEDEGNAHLGALVLPVCLKKGTAVGWRGRARQQRANVTRQL